MVQIRAYREADRDAVLAMADRLTVGVARWRDPGKVTEAVRRWVVTSVDATDEPRAVMVAESGGEVVGFVTVTQEEHWTGELDAYVGELVVRTDHEGRGVGRALVAAAERWAIDQGLRRIRLATGAANAGALHLYESGGYEREDITLSRALDAGV